MYPGLATEYSVITAEQWSAPSAPSPPTPPPPSPPSSPTQRSPSRSMPAWEVSPSTGLTSSMPSTTTCTMRWETPPHSLSLSSWWCGSQLQPPSQVLEQLGEAAKDEETTVTTITGAGFKDRYLAAEEMKVVSGKYFSSGNDMTSFSEVPAGGRRDFSTLKGERLIRWALSEQGIRGDFGKQIFLVVTKVKMLSSCWLFAFSTLQDIQVFNINKTGLLMHLLTFRSRWWVSSMVLPLGSVRAAWLKIPAFINTEHDMYLQWQSYKTYMSSWHFKTDMAISIPDFQNICQNPNDRRLHNAGLDGRGVRVGQCHLPRPLHSPGAHPWSLLVENFSKVQTYQSAIDSQLSENNPLKIVFTVEIQT